LSGCGIGPGPEARAAEGGMGEGDGAGPVTAAGGIGQGEGAGPMPSVEVPKFATGPEAAQGKGGTVPGPETPGGLHGFGGPVSAAVATAPNDITIVIMHTERFFLIYPPSPFCSYSFVNDYGQVLCTFKSN